MKLPISTSMILGIAWALFGVVRANRQCERARQNFPKVIWRIVVFSFFLFTLSVVSKDDNQWAFGSFYDLLYFLFVCFVRQPMLYFSFLRVFSDYFFTSILFRMCKYVLQLTTSSLFHATFFVNSSIRNFVVNSSIRNWNENPIVFLMPYVWHI